MPYKTGKMKGELLVSEIRKLVRLHNKLSKIKIPPRSSRDDIIKIVESNGYKVDHKNQKLTATRMNKDLTLKEAQETFPVKKRVKKEPPKPAEKPKPKKDDEVRPAKKPFPPIPKNIKGKRVNVKFEKPATKERIETGKINVGKVDTTKPKIKIKKEKKVKKPKGEKVKKAVEKIEKKEEKVKKEEERLTKKYLKQIQSFSSDDLKKKTEYNKFLKLKKSFYEDFDKFDKEADEAQYFYEDNKNEGISTMLGYMQTLDKNFEKAQKKAEPKNKKTFGIDVEKLNRKEKEEQADYVRNQGERDMSNEELKERIETELKKQKKGQEVFCSSKIEFLLKDIKDINNTNEKYSEIAKGHGKEKLKYADYRKKFIEDANEILKNHTKYKRKCTEGELTEIRKGLKIMEDSTNVQKFNKRTPTKEEPKKAEPKKANLSKWGETLSKMNMTDIKKFINNRLTTKNQFGYIYTLNDLKNPKNNVDQFIIQDFIKQKLNIDSTQYNKLQQGKNDKDKDLGREVLKKINKVILETKEPKKAEPKKAEPKKAEPKKTTVNFDEIEEGLEDMDDEINAMTAEIRGSSKYSFKKANFTEKEIFSESKFKNMKDLESQFRILKDKASNVTDDDQRQVARNLIENITDRLPFVKDNIK